MASKPAAFAFLEQAQDFFTAAESGVAAAKPLLLYYSFMNLVKAFVLTNGQRTSINRAAHGLKERLDPAPNDKELINAWLEAKRTVPAGSANRIRPSCLLEQRRRCRDRVQRTG